MKYKLVDKRELGDSTLQDSVTVEEGMYKHFQVEHRDGKVFMRSKTRKISSPSYR